MAWVRIDEHFYDHPKWCDAPGDSIALWVAAMAWCNRNDSTEGFIPATKACRLLSLRRPRVVLEDLCNRGAFHQVADGYVIHDYTEYQQPEKVKEIAAKRSASGKKGAAVRWGERLRAADYAQAPPLTDAMAPDMANAMANPMANRWPDTDTDTDTSSSSSNAFSNAPPPPVENEEPEDIRIRIALDQIVATRIGNKPQGNKPAYRKAVAADVRTTCLTELERLAAKYPTAPADVLAASAEGDTHSLTHYAERTAP
jgi:hypothetical protein